MEKHALRRSTEFPSTKDVRAPNSNTDTNYQKPKIVDDVPGKLFKRKQLQAKYYNISAKELPPLNNGEVVRVKPTDRSGRWYKARVEKQVDVRSYDVRTEDGRVFRRNRRHLRSSKEPVRSSSKPVSLSMPEGTFTALLPPNEPVPGTSQEFSPPKEAAAAEKPNTSLNPTDVYFNAVYACKASGFASYSQWSDLQTT